MSSQAAGISETRFEELLRKGHLRVAFLALRGFSEIRLADSCPIVLRQRNHTNGFLRGFEVKIALV
jgi:hypothetical protein